MRSGSVGMNAVELKHYLAAFRYDLTSEDSIQVGIAGVLRAGGVAFERETRLSSRDRLDFLVGDVAIEVKLKGTVNDLLRQLSRYTEHESVGELLVVTGRVQLSGLPEQIVGKPLECIPLLGSMF